MTNSLKTHDACEGCCNCCKYGFQIIDTQIRQNISHEKYEEYLKIRSEECVVLDNERYLAYKQYQPCPQLDEETGTCKIYEDRPWYCKKYPMEWHFVWKHFCKLMRERFAERNPQLKSTFRTLKIPGK
jgi:Fe-S-cluster containining protein